MSEQPDLDAESLDAMDQRRKALLDESARRLALGDPRGALRAQQQAVDVLAAMSARARWYRRILALETLNLAMVSERAGRLGAALRHARQARALFTVVSQEDDSRFGPEIALAQKELRRLWRVRLFLQPRRR